MAAEVIHHCDVLGSLPERRLVDSDATRPPFLSSSQSPTNGPVLAPSHVIPTERKLTSDRREARLFALEAQEGRLFKPLAFTKTYAMAGAALLSMTVVPALVVWLVRGKILAETRNPLNKAVLWAYRPALAAVLRHRFIVLTLAVLLLASSIYPLRQIGSELMPPLDEGDLLYMPTTLPGLSITKAREILQQIDRIIATVPEVERVFGKIGRTETATDPAPLSMIETTITLKPRSEWRPGMTPQKLIAAQFQENSDDSGLVDAEIELAAEGVSIHSLRRSLRGSFALAIRDGNAASKIAKEFVVNLTRSLFMFWKTERDPSIGCGVTTLAIEDGVASVQTLLVRGKQITVTGSGEVDLVEGHYDLELVPKTSDPDILSLAPEVHVKGPLDDPRFVTQKRTLVTSFARGLM